MSLLSCCLLPRGESELMHFQPTRTRLVMVGLVGVGAVVGAGLELDSPFATGVYCAIPSLLAVWAAFADQPFKVPSAAGVGALVALMGYRLVKGGE